MFSSVFPGTIPFQEGDGGFFAFLTSTVGLLCSFGFLVIAIIGMWRMFTKAGQPGWGSLIPIYNIYLLLKIAGRPGWWLLLLLIPIVDIVVWLIVSMDIAKSFGKSAAYGIILLFLLSGLGFLILGLGDAQYKGPAASITPM